MLSKALLGFSVPDNQPSMTAHYSQSIRTAASGRRSTPKALSSALGDAGICDMRGRIVAKKKKVAGEANKQPSTKKTVPKVTKKAEADEDVRQLTKLLDRALKGCVEDVGSMADATVAESTSRQPLALKLAKVYLVLCKLRKPNS